MFIKKAIPLAIMGVSLLLGGCAFLVPPPPDGVTASYDRYLDKILVSWNDVSGARRYEVWRSTSEQGDYERIGEVDGSMTSYEDRNVEAGQDYYYRVKACNRFGCSDFSAAARGRVRATPPAPTGLRASQGDFPDKVLLTWDASQGATGYDIQRAESQGGPYSDLAVGVVTTSYEDTEVTPGTTYWYRVRACNQAGCSAWTAPVVGYASRGGNVPDAPQNLSASDGEYSGKIVVTWDGVEGINHYLVYRSRAENGEYVVIAQTTNTSFDDTTVEVGSDNVYWYKVRACADGSCGPFSNVDSGWAGEDVPPSPPG